MICRCRSDSKSSSSLGPAFHVNLKHTLSSPKQTRPHLSFASTARADVFFPRRSHDLPLPSPFPILFPTYFAFTLSEYQIRYSQWRCRSLKRHASALTRPRRLQVHVHRHLPQAIKHPSRVFQSAIVKAHLKARAQHPPQPVWL